MSNQDGRWLSIREAALELGTSELTIRRRIKSRRLPSRLEGGKDFVRVDAGEMEPEPQLEEPEEEIASQNAEALSESKPRGQEQLIPASELVTLLADRTDLAEAAGRAALLQQQLEALEGRYMTLQEGALALANRNGWLESKLEEREREIKLLTDSQHRVSWWRRLFLGG